MEFVKGHRGLTILTAGAAICLVLTAARCGSSPRNTTPSPPRSTAPVIVLPAPTSQAPSATPTATATPSPTGALGDLSGTWSGNWADTSPDTAAGTFKVIWTQQGSTVSGTITISGTPCLSGGTVSGTISGSKITFGAVQGQRKVDYTGSVSGTSMHGTYSAPKCGNAVGNWNATQN